MHIVSDEAEQCHKRPLFLLKINSVPDALYMQASLPQPLLILQRHNHMPGYARKRLSHAHHFSIRPGHTKQQDAKTDDFAVVRFAYPILFGRLSRAIGWSRTRGEAAQKELIGMTAEDEYTTCLGFRPTEPPRVRRCWGQPPPSRPRTCNIIEIIYPRRTRDTFQGKRYHTYIVF